MWIDTEDAGRICGVSGSYFSRLAKSLGYKPQRYAANSASRCRWQIRHVLAIILLATLEKQYGVPTANAIDTADAIGKGFSSDEALEHALKGRRSCVMLVGNGKCHLASTTLYFAPNIAMLAKEREAELDKLGMAVSSLDISPMWDGIRAAAKGERVTAD